MPVIAASCIAASGCGDSSGPKEEGSVSDFISRVTTVDGAVEAVLVNGERPAAGSGPMPSASGPSVVITGGSSQVGLAASAGFSTVVIAVDGRPDYYRITLPAAVTEVEVIVTIAQDPPEAAFDCVYAVGSGTSEVGAYATTPVSVLEVGTGDVQVSVSWDSPADVDLHVVEPGGEEIYYAHETSASGGTLDLDSNAGCGSDGPRNENATWAAGTAPRGDYTVRVDYWDNCATSATNYVVTVRVGDRAPQTFCGSFSGTGDQGGEGAGVLITTFTH
jgi:hypothetical protein